MVFVEAECPVCESELVHEIDVFSNSGKGFSANVEVMKSWELREFISLQVAEFFQMLPLGKKEIEEVLSSRGVNRLAEQVVEEVKLYGAYEKDGLLIPV